MIAAHSVSSSLPGQAAADDRVLAHQRQDAGENGRVAIEVDGRGARLVVVIGKVDQPAEHRAALERLQCRLKGIACRRR